MIKKAFDYYAIKLVLKEKMFYAFEFMAFDFFLLSG